MKFFLAAVHFKKEGFHIFLLLILSTFTSSSFATTEVFTSKDRGQLFTIQGSNTIGAHLAPEWAKAYLGAKGAKNVVIEPLLKTNEYRVSGRNIHHTVYIDIHAHGSSTGFKGLQSSQADLAMSSRRIKNTELSSLEHFGDMQAFNAEHIVAIDGLAVIVHPANPIFQLSVDQVAKIFSGQIRNWQALGGSNKAITLYSRDSNSGTFDTFKSLVLQKKYTLSGQAERFESNDHLSDRVSQDEGAIGFVGLASVRNARALAISDTNTLALLPETVFVATEDYPLSRRLFLYSPSNINHPYVSEFIKFAQSQAGQRIVEHIGFISQNPRSLNVEINTGPNEYQALSRIAERLSINFRFKRGQADLDNKALQDIERLASYLNTHHLRHMIVQLVGFSNVESTESRAVVLSRLRASAVRLALSRYGIKTQSIIGFGDDMPVANEQGSSALKNDRVEVWVIPLGKPLKFEGGAGKIGRSLAIH